MATVTARGRARREQLLEAMAQLVAERGFDRVGIVEIGAAAGVSGSALYRHFDTKQAMLVALLERVVDDLLAHARAVLDDATDDEAALDALIAGHVEFALRDRAIIKVYDQEAHTLPDADRHRLRATMHRYADVWVGVLRRVRPTLTRAEADVAVRAAFGLVNATADYASPLTPDEEARLLERMCRRALLG